MGPASPSVPQRGETCRQQTGGGRLGDWAGRCVEEIEISSTVMPASESTPIRFELETAENLPRANGPPIAEMLTPSYTHNRLTNAGLSAVGTPGYGPMVAVSSVVQFTLGAVIDSG